MKHIRLLLADARRHQGLALIIVLSMLALATIVILAFLSVADTENKATNIYSASQTSRRFADTAVNMVISQIRSGSARETAGVPVIHATQPGALRKYSTAGSFLAGYKLFSDKDMIYRGLGNAAEQNFVLESEPPSDWNDPTNEARYVDLNEPVIKGVALDANTNQDNNQVFFPIIDPRAGLDIDPTGTEVGVEGFSYSDETRMRPNNNIGDGNVNGSSPPIVIPTGAGMDPNQLRLAMPVQWLYVLKDGAVGFLQPDTLEFRVLDNAEGLGDGPSVNPQANYGVPSEENPIVGRIAFWADDETSKININTASEPTYAGLPIYYHERDHRWADYPPARSEYQRFPGHPATVALSSVFYANPLQDPGRSLDTYRTNGPLSGAELNRVLEIKDRIYDLMPRIHTGGSRSGTRSFAEDDYRNSSGDNSNSSSIAVAMGERLYASVDELLFAQGSANGQRVLNQAQVSQQTTLFDKTSLERSSAFLTAHSRASEINLYGLPRIAMWPIAPNRPSNNNKRTGFDKLVEFCSRLGGTGDINPDSANLYVFQREHSATIPGSVNGARHDISLPRNIKLLNMLDRILDQPFPTDSKDPSNNGRSFKDSTKFGVDNARQLLVSMFDYIRCTNLYDSFLIPQSRNNWPSASINWTTLYQLRDSSGSSFNTYTPGVVRDAGNSANPFADRFLPGHGQVTPAEHPTWKSSATGDSLRGFGRFISLSEVGLQLICTADGQPDMYSWRIPTLVPPTGPTDPKGNFRIPTIAPSNFVAASQGASPTISGGRTALKVDEADNDGFRVAYRVPVGWEGGNARLINIPEVHWKDGGGGVGSDNPAAIKDRYYSNYPPLSQPDQAGLYGTTAIPGNNESPNYGRFYQRHPGYDWRNWNWTLDPDTPLTPTQKRVQALLHLEFFCPSLAYTEINPDYTVVISASDISSIEVAGNAVFSTTTPVAIRSERPLYETDGNPEVGGFASFRNVATGRRVGPRSPMPEDVGYDASATSQVHSGLVNMDLVSSFFTVQHTDVLSFQSATITLRIYDHHVLASTTEEPVQIIKFKLAGGSAPTPDLVTQGSYLVNFQRGDGSTYNHPAIQAPRWWTFNRDGCIGRYDNTGGKTDMDTKALASIRGRFYRWDGPGGSQVDTETRAYNPNIGDNLRNQSVPGARSLIYTKDPANYIGVELQENSKIRSQPLARIAYGPSNDPNYSNLGLVLSDETSFDLRNYNRPWHFGSDVVRTMVPAHGDPRLVAAKKTVEETEWSVHPRWDDTNAYAAHNFSSYSAGSEPGFDRGNPLNTNDTSAYVRILPSKVRLDGTNGAGAGRTPDVPHSPVGVAAFQKYYDFDDGDPGGRVGAYIGKVDEGNFAVGDFTLTGWPGPKKWRATYFRSNSQGARFASGSGSFFSPNRMVPSPVVMGSLPTNIWGANGEGAWQNLLFRPYVTYNTGDTGAPTNAAGFHPGQNSPPDHYLLDLFWMPVVEPYAISEPLSTAGKINLNYQMLPFTHIRRATALHAAMKGEMISAIPNQEYEESKSVLSGWTTNGDSPPVFRSEAQNKYWHRSIVIDSFRNNARNWWDNTDLDRTVQGTLRQFEERFHFSNTLTTSGSFKAGLFRTASQLCEVHLIPGDAAAGVAPNVSSSSVATPISRQTAMANFWSAHCATGDNTRERPYANLYAKFTTRSNTFRVHVRAQAIRKARRSVAANVFDPKLDLPSGEFRGSFLLERYIDQADLTAAGINVDYASSANPFALKPLENYYRFRVLESKRFAP